MNSLKFPFQSNFVPTVYTRFARFTVEVYRRLALLTTPTDRAAENQFLLLQSAGLGLRAMEYKKCKCCAKRRRTNKLTDWQ